MKKHRREALAPEEIEARSFAIIQDKLPEKLAPKWLLSGFVNVDVSKEALIASGIPCIVSQGRQGGSHVAAAIVNALAYMLMRS